jgi:hypothetical protein
MPRTKGVYRHRTELNQSGAFYFLNWNTCYGDDGIDNLLQQVHFDQADWIKVNSVGSGLFKNVDEPSTGRVYQKLLPQVFSSGNCTLNLKRRFQMPQDFGAFPVNAVTGFARRSGAVTGMTLSILRGGSVIDTLSISPGSSGVWQAFQMTPADPNYAPGEFLTALLQLAVGSSTATEADFADLSLLYKTARGNV